jgi:hypothetical protein
MKEYWQKESEKSIKKITCRNCNGVIVKSWAMSLAAQLHGKKCQCEKPSLGKNEKQTKRLQNRGL